MTLSNQPVPITLRRLFLLDATGACLSAALLGLLLPRFQQLIGLPLQQLYWLALGACILAVYSGSCFLFAAFARPFQMRLLALLNGFYLMISLCVVLMHTAQMKPFGYLYFAGETALVLLLVATEWKASRYGMKAA